MRRGRRRRRRGGSGAKNIGDLKESLQKKK